MADLNLKSEVTVENAQAVAALRQTEQAVQQTRTSIGQAGTAAAAASAPMRGVAAAANDLAPAATRAATAGRALQASMATSVGALQANTAAVSALTAQLTLLQGRMTTTAAVSTATAGRIGGVGVAAGSAGAAMGRMGAAVGMVAGPLASFAGAALGTAVGGLFDLALRSGDAGVAALSMAERYGEAGARIDRTFTTPMVRAGRYIRESVSADIRLLVDGTVQDLDRLAKGVEWLRARLGQPAPDSSDVFTQPKTWMARLNAGVAMGASTSTGDIEARAQAAFNSQLTTSVGVTERYRAAVAALRSEKEAGRLSEAQYEQQYTALLSKREAGLTALKAAQQANAAATRDGQRTAREAAREAQRDLEKQIELIEEMTKARRNFDAFAAKPSDAARFATDLRGYNQEQDRNSAARDTDDLAGIVDAIEAAREAGQEMADAANQRLISRAGDIGGLIGGHAGSVLGGIIAGLKTGDFAGVGGPLGGALGTISSSPDFREAMKPVVETFQKVFGDKPFGQTIGSALQGAGVGSQIGGLLGGSKESKLGASIGGALGQVAGEALGKAAGSALGSLGAAAGPLGAIAGSLLGAVVGKLLTPTKTGSVTLSGSGGEVNVGAATGTGGSQRSNSSRAANSISSALSQIADQLGGEIGKFAVSIGMSNNYYRVDTTGQGRTKKGQAGVMAFGEDAAAAVQAALADAIADGAITGVSPRVQTALRRYADDIDRALAEAMKVQGLEDVLANAKNPFSSLFRDFERQAAERVKIATRYGFDVLEIEKLNAEQRAKLLKDQLASVAQSARTLLDSLRFGDRAEGSIVQRLAGLSTERSRLQGLVDGGDTSQIDALTRIIEQQLDLTREAYGSTSPFAAERDSSMAALDAIVRQTEARINEAAAAATAAQTTNAQLTEANITLDEQTVLLQQIRDNLAVFGAGGGGTRAAFESSQYFWANAL